VIADLLPAAPPPIAVTIRRAAYRDLAEDDRGYVRGSWAEGYKNAPKMARLPWAAYKRIVVPELEAALARPDTEIHIAEHGDDIVGWIALSRGARVDTVHWVHTRFRIGQTGVPLRHRGVMSSLFAAAELRKRIVYTFRGPTPRGRDRRVSRETGDERVVRWLATRGYTAAFVDFSEWAR
jgi:hypothetical protein